MTLIETVRTQLSDYPRVHRARANLLLHVVAIPLFWLGAGAAIGAFVSISWRFVALAAVLISVSIGLQAVGHAREREKARPFSGFGNFALRLTTESLVVFPRFVFAGAFRRAWRGERLSER